MSNQIDWPDEQTFSQRVYGAYTALVEERRSPDVPIAELYARVGGSLAELHDFLRAECQAHHCVPTTGEPAFATPEAKRTALSLLGEREVFLNVKLLEPPAMVQEQPQRVILDEHQLRALAEMLQAFTEIRRPANEQGRTVRYMVKNAQRSKTVKVDLDHARLWVRRLKRGLGVEHPITGSLANHGYDLRLI